MISELSLTFVFVLFGVATVVIFFSGLRMTTLADQIADRTGLGEALIGGMLLGAATSLSGAVVSLTSALDGRASLAFSNGIGGIAAQTAFLAVGDLFYRRANLEHASAELANVFQCALLLVLLTLPVLAVTTPEFSILSVHPVSVAIPILYVAGAIATKRVKEDPMWIPEDTEETRRDEPEEDDGRGISTTRLFIVFGILMALMGVAGWTIAQCASVLTDRLGLSGSLVGALMTAVVTSLPELVTTVAAVRRGALQLAVGGIIGGNTFDTLFLTLSDAGYRDGSLYHAVGQTDYFWNVVGILMTGILLLGLLLRERQGTARIGFESVSMLAVYMGAVALQATLG